MKLNILKITLALMAISMHFNISAQEHLTMSMLNITATSTEISFDLYLKNDGNSNIKLSGFSYGIDWNPGIVNNGTLQFVKATPKTPINYPFPNLTKSITVTKDVNQAKIICSNLGYSSALLLQTKQQFYVGRYKMVNSISWSVNSHPYLELLGQIKRECTSTMAIGYLIGGNNMLPFTVDNGKLSLVWDESPVLNSVALRNFQDNSIANTIKTVKPYPNPVLNTLYVEISSSLESTTEVLVLDIFGRVILEQRYSLVQGLNTISLDLNSISKGVYYFKMKDSGSKDHSYSFTK